MIGYKMGSTLAGFTLRPSLYGGELKAWMKTMTWLPTWQLFLLGDFSRGQVS
jgi:hypothetical protein